MTSCIASRHRLSKSLGLYLNELMILKVAQKLTFRSAITSSAHFLHKKSGGEVSDISLQTIESKHRFAAGPLSEHVLDWQGMCCQAKALRAYILIRIYLFTVHFVLNRLAMQDMRVWKRPIVKQEIRCSNS